MTICRCKTDQYSSHHWPFEMCNTIDPGKLSILYLLYQTETNYHWLIKHFGIGRQQVDIIYHFSKIFSIHDAKISSISASFCPTPPPPICLLIMQNNIDSNRAISTIYNLYNYYRWPWIQIEHLPVFTLAPIRLNWIPNVWGNFYTRHTKDVTRAV